jgi:hypothetical protein
LNYLKIPLFLVLAADLLQLFINDAFFQGLITLPLDRSYGQDCPIVQYADDTNHHTSRCLTTFVSQVLAPKL